MFADIIQYVLGAIYGSCLPFYVLFLSPLLRFRHRVKAMILSVPFDTFLK